jgi:large conductance mechanosensitive channel
VSSGKGTEVAEKTGERKSGAAKTGALAGFREFLMRGNVVELAVAVVVGAAFTKIVDAVVKGIINPVIGAFGSQDLERYRSCLSSACSINAKGEVTGIYIQWGSVLSAGLTFVLTAGVVYFLMILPMNRFSELRRRRTPQGEPAPVPVTELDLLAEIRDLLARTANGTAPAERATVPGPNTGKH